MTKRISDMPSAAWFKDRGGLRWHCVFWPDIVRCNSERHDFTAASHETFARWAWERENA